MVQAWVANISGLCEETCYRRCYEKVPVFRQQKADRIQNRQKKAQSIGVWLLYEHMRGLYFSEQEPVYNFSHSGEYVACAMWIPKGEVHHRQRVGCDVEQVREMRLAVARRFFAPAEYEEILQEKNERARQVLFFRYWVLKESFVKATGQGLHMGLNGFRVCPGDPSRLLEKPEAFPEFYFYREAAIEKGKYRIAVCATDADININIQKEMVFL